MARSSMFRPLRCLVIETQLFDRVGAAASRLRTAISALPTEYER
jgi:hypothetical protein